MKTVRFKYSSSFGGYRCSEPGDQDGLYVRAEVAQKMLAACQRFVKNAACSCSEGGPGFVCDVCEGRAAIAAVDYPLLAGTNSDGAYVVIGERDDWRDRNPDYPKPRKGPRFS